MTKALTIVTGATRGFGKAAAELALKAGDDVIGLGRTEVNLGYPCLIADLNNLEQTQKVWEDSIRPKLAGRAHINLINNAGILDPMGPCFNASLEDLDRALRVNVAVPLWMMGKLIHDSDASSKIRIVNVGSGASTSAYPGWMAYCSTKAALRMGGAVVGVESQEYDALKSRDIRVMDYAPGVLNTAMQENIRSQSKESFPRIEKFVELHKGGVLVEPEVSARTAIEFLQSGKGEPFVEARFQG